MKQENRGGKQTHQVIKVNIQSTVLVSLRVPKSLETEVRQVLRYLNLW
jgi:hypothetical protein